MNDRQMATLWPGAAERAVAVTTQVASTRTHALKMSQDQEYARLRSRSIHAWDLPQPINHRRVAALGRIADVFIAVGCCVHTG